MCWFKFKKIYFFKIKTAVWIRAPVSGFTVLLCKHTIHLIHSWRSCYIQNHFSEKGLENNILFLVLKDEWGYIKFLIAYSFLNMELQLTLWLWYLMSKRNSFQQITLLLIPELALQRSWSTFWKTRALVSFTGTNHSTEPYCHLTHHWSHWCIISSFSSGV